MDMNIFIVEDDKDLKDIDYTKEINSYIDMRNDELLKDLRKHEQSEVKRAQTEMDNFLKNVKKEIDSIYKSELTNAKKEITTRVNEKIISQQEDVDKALENKLIKK